MDPLEVSCAYQEPMPDGRNCDADAGQPCRWKNAAGDQVPTPGLFHQDRLDAFRTGDVGIPTDLIDRAAIEQLF